MKSVFIMPIISVCVVAVIEVLNVRDNKLETPLDK